MKFYKLFLLTLIGAFFMYSCSNNDDSIITDPEAEEEDEVIPIPYENGFLITNQGPETTGFGSVDFINADVSAIDTTIYQDVNNETLGNQVQSIGFLGNFAYIIASGSDQITVVNRFTFQEIGRIETGLQTPRYFVEANGVGYVSNWGDPMVATDDFIAVINLSTNEVTSTIPVGEGPEQMIFNRFNIYVANQGGLNINNTVTVIDPEINEVTSTIPVGDIPNSMQLDDFGNLWVLAEGSPASSGNETAGTITRINTSSNQIITTFVFGMQEHPTYLNLIGDDLYYYMEGNVFRTTVSNFQIPTTAEISGVNFSNMVVVNATTLMGTDIGDGASNGAVMVYNLQSNTLAATLNTGIRPNNVYVNP